MITVSLPFLREVRPSFQLATPAGVSSQPHMPKGTLVVQARFPVCWSLGFRCQRELSCCLLARSFLFLLFQATIIDFLGTRKHARFRAFTGLVRSTFYLMVGLVVNLEQVLRLASEVRISVWMFFFFPGCTKYRNRFFFSVGKHNSTRVEEERKSCNFLAVKNEGAYRSGEGGEDPA